VRDNVLCHAGTEFDAEARKIRRVAPESDAANKLHVEQNVKIYEREIYERLIALIRRG